MKVQTIRFITGCLTAFTMACGIQAVQAQEYVATPVTISKEKVRIDGKIFYSHIVLEKQTLYSISKAYGISIEDIYTYNPTVKELGLQKNSIILIPADASEKQNAVKEEPAEPETVTTQPEVQQEPETTVQNEGSQRHTVKWYEDLTSISEKYGIPEQAIMDANGLKNRKLAKRQVLIIPPKDHVVVFKEQVQDTAAHQVLTERHDSLSYAMTEPIDTVFNTPYIESILKDNVEVTFLLPLKAKGSSSSRGNMDFYSGALLAVRDIAEKGINVKMNVHDIAEGDIGASDHELESSDLIIGPVSYGDINRLYENAPGIGPVVSPLDPRAESLAAKYKTLIHAPATNILQYEDAVNWIKEDHQEGDKVIVIFNKNKEADQNGELAALKTILDTSKVNYTSFSYSILEGRKIQPNLTALMTPTGANRVIIASESEAFVNDAVRNLNLMIASKFNVILYGTSKICSFETIEVENFHNTSLHASLRYHIDYTDPDVQDFIMKYRALFQTEPSQFAFQGYDVTKFFILNCARAGMLWKTIVSDKDMNMLQNNFKIRQSPNDKGFTNKGIKRIVYGKDYSITPVR